MNVKPIIPGRKNALLYMYLVNEASYEQQKHTDKIPPTAMTVKHCLSTCCEQREVPS